MEENRNVLNILALIISICAIIYIAINPAHDGKNGPQGIPGVSPEHEWLSTQLHFLNPDGTWGDYVELKGDKGDKGDQGGKGDQGVQGIQGINGTNGIDGKPELNHKAVISNPVLNGYYNVTSGNYTFTFLLSTKVNDSDNDTLQTIIYYRETPTSLWKPSSVFFETNKTVNATARFISTPSNQKIYWCVMSWDGRDITTRYAEHIVLCP